MFCPDNKQKSRTISFKIRLYLPHAIFTNGRLYIALPRVKSKQRWEFLILDDDENVSTSTTSVVYRDFFPISKKQSQKVIYKFISYILDLVFLYMLSYYFDLRQIRNL